MTVAQMRAQLRQWPIPGLKGVIVIKDGKYVWLWP